MAVALLVNRDGAERLNYVSPGFPVRAVQARLSGFAQYAAACHWHHDFEWLQVLEGEIDYFVHGKIVHIAQGQAIFVNSCRLHYGFSPQKRECLFRTILFHPSVLGETPLPTAVYAAQMAAGGQRDSLLLDPAHHGGMLCQLNKIYDACAQRPPLFEFDVQAACGALTALTWQALSPDGLAAAGDPVWAELRRMTGFLQQHYDEKITLEQIAASGSMCRSRCCRLFRERLNTTPLRYLTELRLEKAQTLLMQGAGVTETAQRCGFEGASYFAEVFRGRFGASPTAFRRLNVSGDRA